MVSLLFIITAQLVLVDFLIEKLTSARAGWTTHLSRRSLMLIFNELHVLLMYF